MAIKNQEKGPKNNLSFGQAISKLQEGEILSRAGWNGKGMWIFMKIGNTVPKDFIKDFKSIPESVKVKLTERGKSVIFAPDITMMTAQGTLQPGWHPSQPDMFAMDWEVID